MNEIIETTANSFLIESSLITAGVCILCFIVIGAIPYASWGADV